MANMEHEEKLEGLLVLLTHTGDRGKERERVFVPEEESLHSLYTPFVAIPLGNLSEGRTRFAN